MCFIEKKELIWTKEQKKLHEQKILEKLEKAKKNSRYTNKLLIDCKSWGGPVTSVEAILEVLKSNPQKAEQIIRTELAYYRDTHRTDVIATPELFKLNSISHEERLENLTVLLNDFVSV